MTERRVALVTGITGQDGAYLADLLLTKGYEVHGVARRCSTSNTVRIAEYQSQPARYPQFHLHNGDVTDGMAMGRLVQRVRPTELYNLAAQSHVGVSFDLPEYTANVDALGPLRILEAICAAGLQNSCRFYQASTSELYGQAVQVPQNETTPFQPRSPYGVAKLYGHWITRNYREAHGVHATNGILFNHESPLRGEAFVSRKISRGVAAIRHGQTDRLVLGNLDARRDWGHARDYVRAMWLMLQQPEPDDYVVATGEEQRVRDLVEWAFAEIGVAIGWDGTGAAERGYCLGTGRCLVAVDPTLFRPAEVDRLLGDPTKARTRLGWRHETSARALISEMMQADLAALGPLPPLLTSVASAA